MEALKRKFFKLLIKYSNYYKSHSSIKNTIPRDLVSIIKLYVTKKSREENYAAFNHYTTVDKEFRHFVKTRVGEIEYPTKEQEEKIDKISKTGKSVTVDMNKLADEAQFLHFPKNIKSLEIYKDPGEYLETFLKKANKLKVIRYHIDGPINTSSKNLKKIYFGNTFNTTINNFLKSAKRLKVLGLGYWFNQKIENYPKRLRILIFGENSNQPLENLPKNLKKLNMFMVQNYYYTELNNLPKNLKFLGLGANFNKSVDNLPNSLESLEFHKESEFNKQINCFPKELKILKFGYAFNQKLKKLPKKLKILKLGENFNQNLNNLPKRLAELYFPKFGFFNKKLKKLPKNLKLLRLKGTYIHSDKDILPKKLKILLIDTLDKETIQIIPKNLQVLKIYNIDNSSEKYIAKLPLNLRIEILNKEGKFKRVKNLLNTKIKDKKETFKLRKQYIEREIKSIESLEIPKIRKKLNYLKLIKSNPDLHSIEQIKLTNCFHKISSKRLFIKSLNNKIEEIKKYG